MPHGLLYLACTVRVDLDHTLRHTSSGVVSLSPTAVRGCRWNRLALECGGPVVSVTLTEQRVAGDEPRQVAVCCKIMKILDTKTRARTCTVRMAWFRYVWYRRLVRIQSSVLSLPSRRGRPCLGLAPPAAFWLRRGGVLPQVGANMPANLASVVHRHTIFCTEVVVRALGAHK